MATPASAQTGFDLGAAAPRISEWARMAARSFGTYAGINQAIKAAPEKWLPAVHIAASIRDEMTILSVIRVHALLDRDATVSLQSVNTYLKLPDAHERVIAIYTRGDHPQFRQLAQETCRTAIGDFKTEYARIDWKVFGQLQAFRNGAIAHISIREVKTLITYHQLERLVRLCGRLSRQVSLMATGLSTSPEEEIRDHAEDGRRFWGTVFVRAAKDTVAAHAVADRTQV